MRGSLLTPPSTRRNLRRAPLNRPVWPNIEAQSLRDLFVQVSSLTDELKPTDTRQQIGRSTGLNRCLH